MDNAASDINQMPVDAAVAAVTQEAERMLPQSKVNELVGNARREAAEKAAQRAVDEYKRQQQSHYSNSDSSTQSSDDHFERKTLEILDKQKAEWERQQQERYLTETAQRIVNTYNQKIESGKEKYQDFEEVVNRVDMRDFSNIVQLLAEHVDNASDVLYDLAKRPAKLDELDRLFERKPQYAISEVKRLADSIKANEQAGKGRTSNSPLSQQRPSNTGTDSGGALSMTDLKRKYRA